MMFFIQKKLWSLYNPEKIMAYTIIQGPLMHCLYVGLGGWGLVGGGGVSVRE
jgi:hypothetical protein